MTKKKKIILISGILLIIIGIILAVFLLKKPQENCSNCEVELTKDLKPKQQVNAYDYIVQTMNEPEYWGVEQMYDYFTEEEVQERLGDIPNGSGWNLKDANTASFIRGHGTKLVYNFSNFTASLIHEFSEFPDVIYDFLNNKFTSYNEDGSVYIEDILIKEFNNPTIDTLYQSGSLDNFDGTARSTFSNIKNSMLNYAYLFEQAGCPILLQPEGTLESYKDKMIIPVENYQKINMNYEDYYDARKNVTDYWGNPYADSSKIDAPWELEDYCYDLRTRTDLQWTDDFTEVVDIAKNLPDIIYETMPENREVSMAIVLFVNKGDYEFVKENFDMYPNVTSNIFTYYHRPILQKIYGKDVVYYCDTKNLKNQIDINHLIINEPENADAKIGLIGFPGGKEMCDAELSIYKTPLGNGINERYNYFCMENERFKGIENQAFLETSYIITASEIENPFSDVYKFNLLLAVDKSLQSRLGLR